jgi:hypothetical protein
VAILLRAITEGERKTNRCCSSSIKRKVDISNEFGNMQGGKDGKSKIKVQIEAPPVKVPEGKKAPEVKKVPEVRKLPEIKAAPAVKKAPAQPDAKSMEALKKEIESRQLELQQKKCVFLLCVPSLAPCLAVKLKWNFIIFASKLCRKSAVNSDSKACSLKQGATGSNPICPSLVPLQTFIGSAEQEPAIQQAWFPSGLGS